GLVDEVVSMHVGVCGPSQRSTRLEQSRCFAKEFLLRHGLPTAPGRTFTDLATAEKYLAAQPLPVVIKADQLEGGDGIFDDRYAALEALRQFFIGSEGVVIEAFLPGVRVAFSALTDGTTSLPLLPLRLYDRLDASEGSVRAPGMGAHTSVSTYATKLTEYMQTRLMQPLVAALAQDGLPYWGFLGMDCIITERGPFITALRCSLHDMEAQVVLPRLRDDLVPLVQAAIARRLDRVQPIDWLNEATVGLTLVAQGYPHHAAYGGPITGLGDLDEGVLVFHHQTTNPAGLRYTPAVKRGPGLLQTLVMGSGVGHGTGGISTTGGHVLTVVARGASLAETRSRALANANRIHFNGRTFREDVGVKEFT
ncbi:MAG: phosphoribosylamine--glycine ligase, partial [Chloroflexaceae bacterium]|nr:phosphoribosylamine--glycine ligase [Chloroflexaceae bacterium]